MNIYYHIFAAVSNNISCFIAVLIGFLYSGGHTAEMLQLLSDAETKQYNRNYIIADTDKMSEMKVNIFEEENGDNQQVSLWTHMNWYHL